jgi:hypothetical protein
MSEFNKFKKQFRQTPTVNPETGRKITKNSNTYNELVKKYGEPIKKKSPRGIKKTPRKVRSPVKSPRVKSDPFDVLSDESILRVLQKLSQENRQVWCASSPRVKNVCTKNNL